MRKWLVAVASTLLLVVPAFAQTGTRGSGPAPTPLVSAGQAADWIFVYKFNSSSFPTKKDDTRRACPFGGAKRNDAPLGQDYVFATQDHPVLAQGSGLVGAGTDDPVGATFSEIYNGDYFFIAWNDQFQGSPIPENGSNTGHSKGILAWNKDGAGLVMQVTTPAWPGSGSASEARAVGNTLGCIRAPIRNNVQYAQHFFMLQLTKDDVAKVLEALANAEVVTSRVEGPIRHVTSASGTPLFSTLIAKLNAPSSSKAVTDTTLSSGIRLISKPPALDVLPWQLVSSVLKAPGASTGPSLRTATWTATTMPETAVGDRTKCPGITADPGAITIAKNGSWADPKNGTRTPFKLTQSSNHAKLGVSTGGMPQYTIFSDLNQDGSVSPTTRKCTAAQNSRGGLFFVLTDPKLHDSVADLIAEP